ncbi:7871_t:CDS:2 [Entrophospora sp. SA101]|nr:7871_t:CDS:2 [Entrophospora sp. SA101]
MTSDNNTENFNININNDNINDNKEDNNDNKDASIQNHSSLPPPSSFSSSQSQPSSQAKDILQDLLDECVADIMLEVHNEEKKSKFIITNELDELDPG